MTRDSIIINLQLLAVAAVTIGGIAATFALAAALCSVSAS